MAFAVPLPALAAAHCAAPTLAAALAADTKAGGGPPAAGHCAAHEGATATGGPPTTPTLRLHAGAAMLPHPDKVAKGGEDAYFLAPDGLSLGVADGVGGWGELGIDAGEYSRALMAHCADEAAAAAGADPASGPDPSLVLTAAHARTRAQGSATACVLAMRGGDSLAAANVGDSGFIVARAGSLTFKSPPQQHGFNFPYQLGAPGAAGDSPADADIFRVAVAAGDVIVAGTDGLFDNVFPEEAATMACDARAGGEGPAAAAAALAAFARSRAADPRCRSPFAVAAQAMGYPYQGGKMDDITVVVAYVSGEGGGAGSAAARL